MGKDLTGVRSLQRKLAPDIVGSDERKQTSLRGIANKAKADKQHRFQKIVCLRAYGLRESEYNRGTGCGNIARPGLCGGCRVTGIPTAEALK